MASDDPIYSNRSEAAEASDDVPANEDISNNINDVLERRYGRRAVLGAMAGSLTWSTAGLSGIGSSFGQASAEAANVNPADGNIPGFDFEELASGVDETHHLASGHEAQILIRWGDPVFADAPPFDPHQQSAKAQLRQFGYNNDYIGFLPLDETGRRGLLCINHEYTNEEVMFPDVSYQDGSDFAEMTEELVDIEMAAHGGTIIEIAFDGTGWKPKLDSRYNRRITPLDTAMTLDGPAAGHERLRTSGDPSGSAVTGTLNNCAGGMTPWGTYLMAEENFHFYFWTDETGFDGKPEEGFGGKQAASAKRYKLGHKRMAWGLFHDRFNLDEEFNEANRFGWVVEVDPLDAGSRPRKHTALGRFCHEGAECILSRDGHAVVYMGDDARFEFLYRFVSEGRYKAGDRAANMKLLTKGTLSAAVFHADGRLEWRALEFGKGPLTPENGFHSQADVLIDARLAASKLGATPMDRPEDVQPNPRTDKVYVLLTNNSKRKKANAANPRPGNRFGHIIEFTPDEGDHAAANARWNMFIQGGDPKGEASGAQWHDETSAHGWFGSPDNAAVDGQGRLWIATDQGSRWPLSGKADGLYALETSGPKRGLSKLFFRAPVGAEVCGPQFTSDGETLFLAVQHPGTDGTHGYPGFNRPSTFEDPATRWPDFNPDHPPRPSVLAIRRKGGGRIA